MPGKDWQENSWRGWRDSPWPVGGDNSWQQDLDWRDHSWQQDLDRRGWHDNSWDTQSGGIHRIDGIRSLDNHGWHQWQGTVADNATTPAGAGDATAVANNATAGGAADGAAVAPQAVPQSIPNVFADQPIWLLMGADGAAVAGAGNAGGTAGQIFDLEYFRNLPFLTRGTWTDTFQQHNVALKYFR